MTQIVSGLQCTQCHNLSVLLLYVLWARGSEPICRDGPISKWRPQSMY